MALGPRDKDDVSCANTVASLITDANSTEEW